MRDLLKKFYKDHSPAKSISLSADSKQRIKDKILMNLDLQIERAQAPDQGWTNLKNFFLRSYIAVPLAIILMISGTAVVSANSLPGDALYPVKRSVEDARVLITVSPQAKENLKVEFARERLREIETLRTKKFGRQLVKSKDDKKLDKDQSKDKSLNESSSTEASGRLRLKLDKKTEDDAKKAVELLNKAKENFKVNNQEDKALEIEHQIRDFESDSEDEFNEDSHRDEEDENRNESEVLEHDDD